METRETQKDAVITNQARQIEDLQQESSESRAIRQRFLDTYRRDILGVDLASYKFITEGNEAAHGGNCWSDLLLYDKGLRSDETTFISLYGLSLNLAKVLSESH